MSFKIGAIIAAIFEWLIGIAVLVFFIPGVNRQFTGAWLFGFDIAGGALVLGAIGYAAGIFCFRQRNYFINGRR